MEAHARHAHPHSHLGEMDSTRLFLGKGETASLPTSQQMSNPTELSHFPTRSVAHLPTCSPLTPPSWVALVVLCLEVEEQDGERMETTGEELSPPLIMPLGQGGKAGSLPSSP